VVPTLGTNSRVTFESEMVAQRNDKQVRTKNRRMSQVERATLLEWRVTSAGAKSQTVQAHGLQYKKVRTDE
jgi:hypothetical protein